MKRTRVTLPKQQTVRIDVLIAQGRDASDVPITQTFGPNTRCGPT